MNTELVCVMASLGYCDGEEYYKGVDCLGKIFLSKNFMINVKKPIYKYVVGLLACL